MAGGKLAFCLKIQQECLRMYITEKKIILVFKISNIKYLVIKWLKKIRKLLNLMSVTELEAGWDGGWKCNSHAFFVSVSHFL